MTADQTAETVVALDLSFTASIQATYAALQHFLDQLQSTKSSFLLSYDGRTVVRATIKSLSGISVASDHLITEAVI